MMAKSLFDPEPEKKAKDITSRFDWIGKSKQEQEESYDLKKMPDAKEQMPSKLVFIFRDYFYEIVNIDIGVGYKMMREQIKPSWRDAKCALSIVKVPLPCGLVIANVQSEEGRGVRGVVEVIELVEGGNAEKAGIRVGDAMRACNAVVAKEVKDQTAFIEADTKKTRALMITDGQEVDNIINAMQSNKEEGFVSMIFERRKPNA